MPPPLQIPDLDEVLRRLAARNREQTREARLLILLGIPFALASFAFFSLLLASLPWLVFRWSYAACLAASAGTVLAALLVDTWKHPSEHWHAANYHLAGVHDPRKEGGILLVSGKGLSAGMPLMAGVSDPGNLAEHGRMLSSGCANLVLGGPGTSARASNSSSSSAPGSRRAAPRRPSDSSDGWGPAGPCPKSKSPAPSRRTPSSAGASSSAANSDCSPRGRPAPGGRSRSAARASVGDGRAARRASPGRPRRRP